MDFGVAGLNSQSAKNEEAGSIKYMPPECFDGTFKPFLLPMVDVWALGCILYGMLFGDLPFNGKTNKETIEKIVEAKWKIPENFEGKISEKCIDLLSKLLTKNAEQRVSMIDVLNHPWISLFHK